MDTVAPLGNLERTVLHHKVLSSLHCIDVQ